MKGGDGSAAKKGIAAKTAGKVATDERTFDVVQFMRSRALQLDAGGHPCILGLRASSKERELFRK